MSNHDRELTGEELKIAQYNRALMAQAVENGRVTKLPKWTYLAKRIKGGMSWLLMFKTYGTSRALEPVYEEAFATRELIPDVIKCKFKRISSDVAEFIRYTEFGEAGGARFAHHIKAIRDCPDEYDTIVSLGAGSSLAEMIGLWHRKQSGAKLPKIHLVDTDGVGLKRAHMFAKLLGVDDCVTYERSMIGSHWKLHDNGDNIFVISVGLIGNYFTRTQLHEILAYLHSQERVNKICIDFVDLVLAEKMKYAVGWPVATRDDPWGVRPRAIAKIMEYYVDGWEHEIIELADKRIRYLEMRRGSIEREV
ncbi:MAG: hypothetical protein FWG45_05400 [Oscillospiraceae bacterium]|nr:hypothetical protein [Oscillospiraceae bacterium]